MNFCFTGHQLPDVNIINPNINTNNTANPSTSGLESENIYEVLCGKLIFYPSLDSRFGKQNSPYFNMLCLHPKEMKQLSRSQLKEIVSTIKEVYSIEHLAQEALTWYDVQKHTSQSETQGKIDLIEETTLFTDVGKAILVALTLPSIPCTAQRSVNYVK